MKEKLIEDQKKDLDETQANLKKCHRQLDDIRQLNRIKKWFLTEIKKDYEDIVLGMMNISVKFA